MPETTVRHPALTDVGGDGLAAPPLCPNCGEPRAGRFLLRVRAAGDGRAGSRSAGLWREFASRAFNLNRGLLHTVVSLAQSPGSVPRDYVEGRRRTYTNPLSFPPPRGDAERARGQPPPRHDHRGKRGDGGRHTPGATGGLRGRARGPRPREVGLYRRLRARPGRGRTGTHGARVRVDHSVQHAAPVPPRPVPCGTAPHPVRPGPQRGRGLGVLALRRRPVRRPRSGRHAALPARGPVRAGGDVRDGRAYARRVRRARGVGGDGVLRAWVVCRRSRRGRDARGLRPGTTSP